MALNFKHMQLQFMALDIGEGTQHQILVMQIGYRESHIFITHMHGDHIFGLQDYFVSGWQ